MGIYMYIDISYYVFR